MIISVIISDVTKVKSYRDGRGWLKEIYRCDENKIMPLMSYISHTAYKSVRGPHEHYFNPIFLYLLDQVTFNYIYGITPKHSDSWAA